jgi:hypothetical protein
LTFDLSFYRTKSVREPRVEELQEFFRGKQNFQMRDFKVGPVQKSLIEKAVPPLEVKGAYQIDYENPSTGVYFQMFYAPPDSSDEMPSFPDLDPTGLGAHVNLVRPSYFALESFPLIVEIANKFGLLTLDSQVSSRHKEPFKADAAALIDSWIGTNSWAVRNLRKEGHDIKHLPKERLEYNWNFLRHAVDMQQRLGDYVFVPTRIFMAERRASLGTFVTWVNYIPMVFPLVDWVVIGQSKDGKDFSSRGVAQLNDILLILANELRSLSEPVPHHLLSQGLTKGTRKKLDELHLIDRKEIKGLHPNVNVVDVPLSN